MAEFPQFSLSGVHKYFQGSHIVCYSKLFPLLKSGGDLLPPFFTLLLCLFLIFLGKAKVLSLIRALIFPFFVQFGLKFSRPLCFFLSHFPFFSPTREKFRWFSRFSSSTCLEKNNMNVNFDHLGRKSCYVYCMHPWREQKIIFFCNGTGTIWFLSTLSQIFPIILIQSFSSPSHNVFFVWNTFC